MSDPRWVHRESYADLSQGRDRHIVKRLSEWLPATIEKYVRAAGSDARVLDIGCGEQPLRRFVEAAGAAYTGFDIEQNSRGSVGVIGFIDRRLPEPWPDSARAYEVILCTEVLEHVLDWHTAFANVRTLLKPGGKLIITVPFIFPLHMEPFDYFRVTPFSFGRLAEKFGLQIEEQHRLGAAADVLATLLDDLSIVAAHPSLSARAKARWVRLLKKGMSRVFQSRRIARNLQFNSNYYLSNAVVLSARER